MLLARKLDRVFIMDDKMQPIPLADPNPAWPPAEVLSFYANAYPILTTAKVSGAEIMGDKLQYRFETMLGTKG